jgi:hypothetical protein
MIVGIVGYAVISIVLHLLTELPKPAAGRHLHGSLTIEIIGVEPLTSNFPLVLWDIIVLLLQLASFSINFTALTADEDDSQDPAKSSDAYAYSGHLLVRNIGIVQSVRENWLSAASVSGQPLPASDSEANTGGNILGTLDSEPPA